MSSQGLVINAWDNSCTYCLLLVLKKQEAQISGCLQGDFPVSKMISGLAGVDPKRKDRLVEVLDINLDWRMHLVSDGQRRRVQLLMGLLKSFEVCFISYPPPRPPHTPPTPSPKPRLSLSPSLES